MRKLARATTVALALASFGGLSQASASPLTAGVTSSLTASTAVATGHHRNGCWVVKRCWVPAKYRWRAIYRCGRFVGYKKDKVRCGYWKRYRCWVPRGCRR